MPQDPTVRPYGGRCQLAEAARTTTLPQLRARLFDDGRTLAVVSWPPLQPWPRSSSSSSSSFPSGDLPKSEIRANEVMERWQFDVRLVRCLGAALQGLLPESQRADAASITSFAVQRLGCGRCGLYLGERAMTTPGSSGTAANSAGSATSFAELRDFIGHEVISQAIAQGLATDQEFGALENADGTARLAGPAVLAAAEQAPVVAELEEAVQHERRLTLRPRVSSTLSPYRASRVKKPCGGPAVKLAGSFLCQSYVRLFDLDGPCGERPAPLRCSGARRTKGQGECGQLLCDRGDVLSQLHTWSPPGSDVEDAWYVNSLLPDSVHVGTPRRERLAQGLMEVADVQCAACGGFVGWHFVRDLNPTQPNRHQVGRFGVCTSSILELASRRRGPRTASLRFVEELADAGDISAVRQLHGFTSSEESSGSEEFASAESDMEDEVA